MTVCHPLSLIGSIENNIHCLTGPDQYGVFPDKVLFDLSVSCRYQEPLTVKMYGVLHRVHGFGVVENPDFDRFASFECPVDIHIFLAGVPVDQLPLYVAGSRHQVHHPVHVFPLDAGKISGFWTARVFAECRQVVGVVQHLVAHIECKNEALVRLPVNETTERSDAAGCRRTLLQALELGFIGDIRRAADNGNLTEPVSLVRCLVLYLVISGAGQEHVYAGPFRRGQDDTRHE